MIVYPSDWGIVGKKVEAGDIEDTLLKVLAEIDCNDLSFSGGLDSSLLLYYLLKLGRKVRTFTLGVDKDHPDIKYSRKVVDYFEKEFDTHIERYVLVDGNGNEGDPAVAEYYRKLSYFTDSIIAGDGIDEFMGGYYSHQQIPTEATYYAYLYKLQKEHLIPLDKNSDEVKVYLPYIDKRLICLMSQIPISEKVDNGKRKKMMVELAQGKLPREILLRRKCGFSCRIKKR